VLVGFLELFIVLPVVKVLYHFHHEGAYADLCFLTFA